MTGHLGRRVLVPLLVGLTLAAIAVVPRAAAAGGTPRPTCVVGYSRGQVHDIVDAYVHYGPTAGRKAWAAVDDERYWASYEPCGS